MPSCPLAADDVADHEVDLRAVEGGLAGLLGEGHAEGLGGVAAGGLGLVPHGGGAGVFVGVGIAETDAHAVVGHAERGEDGLHERQAAHDLALHLLLGAEEVGVVLGEAADAGHAVELAGLFPAVDGAELGEAHGQIAVAVRLRGEDLDVVRAVHRLQQEARR